MYAVSKLARNEEERELRDVLPERAAETADGKTSPEELIAAAHTEGFAMQFSALLGSRVQRQIAERPRRGGPWPGSGKRVPASPEHDEQRDHPGRLRPGGRNRTRGRYVVSLCATSAAQR